MHTHTNTHITLYHITFVTLDLMKNLRLSEQSVPKDLETLAQSDKDWSRRQHELKSRDRDRDSHGSGGGGGGGGYSNSHSSRFANHSKGSLGLGHGQKGITLCFFFFFSIIFFR